MLGDYQRGLDDVASEMEQASRDDELSRLASRAHDLTMPAIRYIASEAAFLGPTACQRFIGAHPDVPTKRPSDWPANRFDAWEKVRARVLHLDGFVRVASDLLGEASPLAPVTGREATRQETENELVAIKRLLSATVDETAFLNLFCTGDILMVHEKPETWLPHSAYRAGEKLAQDGILTQHDLPDDKLKFCLPDATYRAWKGSGLPAQPVRKCVEINLHAVCGTGSSGSGAWAMP